MRKRLKKAIGPTQAKFAPLKSSSGEIITEKSKLECWVEHYSHLYGAASFISLSSINQIEKLPTLFELDAIPTKLSEAIKAISSDKAPGLDGIPAEIFKCGGEKLLDTLHRLLCKCWELSIHRLQKLADRVYPELQCGFRSNRSTVDMIFTLRQLQEKCSEKQRPLFVAFIDLTKAFDSVSREGLFHILPLIGCAPKLFNFIKTFHVGNRGTVKFGGDSSEVFDINIGVKQECVLTPTLFNIFFSILLKHAFGSAEEGILLHTRSDGKYSTKRDYVLKPKSAGVRYTTFSLPTTLLWLHTVRESYSPSWTVLQALVQTSAS